MQDAGGIPGDDRQAKPSRNYAARCWKLVDPDA
jgi:hypothetical protein